MASCLTATVLVAALGVGVLASMPTTVVTAGWSGKAYAQLVLPQSWQFFTRDPKTPAFVLYDDRGDDRGDVDRADTLPQTRSENAFGLSRGQRAQDTEKVLLSQGVTSWVECGGRPSVECLEAAADTTATDVAGVPGDPWFCDTFVLAEQETTRFNFRDVSGDDTRVIRAAHLDVTCS